jgi:SAM-dependent methyltransferase
MNWKLKGLAQSALSRVPYAGAINYWGQKYVTRAHDPVPAVEDRLGKARWFLGRYGEHGGADPGVSQFFEFGAGWDLAGPLSLYSLGVNRQHIVDITPCARLELVNGVIAELNRRGSELPRPPGAPLPSLAELEPRFGIRYRAPADARATSLPRASVDCIVSTYTMEHIPEPDLRAILAESLRILKPAGLMLSLIDYQDHYSYRDPAISVYNFLQYSDWQWRWFNSSLHYQNRLRHSQYHRLFAEAGFEILEEELKRPEDRDLARFRKLRLAPAFHSFTAGDLTILASGMVCRRPPRRESEAGAPRLAEEVAGR